MFYNSYNVYRQYSNNYYNLCNSMAAYLRQPWISSNLAYFYGYNGNQLNNSCYQSQGMWYYLPYQQGCQQWVPTQRTYTNQCYGSTVSYRPGYLWQSRYAYNNNCRRYQSQWQWPGYWRRYHPSFVGRRPQSFQTGSTQHHRRHESETRPPRVER